MILKKQDLKNMLGKKVYIPCRNDTGVVIAIDTKSIDNYMETEPLAIKYDNYKDAGEMTLKDSIKFLEENKESAEFEHISEYGECSNWDWFFPENVVFLDQEIIIKYHNKEMPKLIHDEKGRIDLRVNNIYGMEGKSKFDLSWFKNEKGNKIKYLFKGEKYFIDLGVAMQLPKGYEAEITPRSSLFKNHGLLLTNSPGIIDNTYNGNNDKWGAILYATEDTELEEFERILQFTIKSEMKRQNFIIVEDLGNENRGGYGSTGRK